MRRVHGPGSSLMGTPPPRQSPAAQEAPGWGRQPAVGSCSGHVLPSARGHPNAKGGFVRLHTTLPVVPQAAAIQWHGDAHESESDAE